MKKWILHHWHKLITLQATPEAIAGGFAVGIWWGFTPFFGLKTFLAIATAWGTRTNKIAAIIAVSLYDILFLLILPILYFQYQVGCLIQHKPPASIHVIKTWSEGGLHSWLTWRTFHAFFVPTIYGAMLVGSLLAIIAYHSMRFFISRFQSERAIIEQLRKSGILPLVSELPPQKLSKTTQVDH